MHFMLKLADSLARLVLYAFVFIVISLAIMTSLLRYYLPQADQYRASLLSLLSEQSQWQVDAEQLEAKWQQFRPSLALYNAHLANEETGHRVNLAYLHIEVNIVKSLYYRKLYLENLALDGLEVVLLQDQHGSWGITANPDNPDPIAVDELAEYIWSIASFNLQSLSLTMVPYQKEAMYFPQLSATLQTWLNQKLFQLDLNEGDDNRSRLIIEAQNHFEDVGFNLAAYWRLQDFPLHLLLPLIEGLQIHKESRISQEMWFQWRDGKPSGVGSFSLDSLNFNYKDKLWDAEHAQGRFYLDTDVTKTTVLGIPNLSLTLNDQHINVDKVKVQLQEQQTTVQIASLDLGELNDYLKLIQLPPRLQELRERLDAEGQVQNINVAFFENDMLLQANLSAVTVGAWNGAPALRGVNGFVEASFFSGYVDFYSDDFSMAFPLLYDDSMSFDRADGKVYWQVADTIKVGSQGILSLQGPYGKALGQFQLEIPKASSQDVGRISLVVDLKDGDARYRNYLVPATLNENLLTWLDNSIGKGWVNHGSFIYHGPIVADSEEQKVVQLWLDVDDATIRFHPDFAPVEEIKGQFLLDQLIGEAKVRNAKTQQLSIEDAGLNLWFTEKKPRLIVQANLQQQQASSVLSYLQQDFISARSKQVFDDWQVNSGVVNAEVQVEVPLDQIDDLNVIVKGSLHDVKLDFARFNLSLSSLAGDLLFDLHQGVSSQTLSATLWGKPVIATIETQQQISRLQFDYQQLAMTTLEQWLDLPAMGLIKGKADVTGVLSWGEGQADLQIASDLQGVSINLPKPLGKAADEQADFEVRMPLASAAETVINMSYAEQVDLAIAMKEGKFTAASLAINDEITPLEEGLIRLTGRLPDAQATAWMHTVDQFRQQQKNSTTSNMLAIQVDKLWIERLDLFGFQFDDSRFSLKNPDQAWLLDLKHPDLEGRLLIPMSDEKVPQLQIDQINLAHLLSARAELDEEIVGDVSFAPFQVAIDELRFDQDSYGQWQFAIEANNGAVKVQQIEALVKSMELTRLSDDQHCELHWQRTGEEYTEVNCRFVSSRIDRFLRDWGMEQGVFSEEFKLDVVGGRWQGSPIDFEMNKSYLPLSLSLKNGYFADVDSASTDALKALGFFNLSNIVRRLKLDFKDLSQEGLTFDRVKGGLLLDQGIMRDSTPMIIKSSASEIKVTGEGDFNRQVLDIDMAVSLPLVNNLPWVVALAAGLPAAVGVFIISKLLGKQVNKLSTAVYHVSGDMANPKIKFKRLFDVEKDKKKEDKPSN